MIRENIYRKIKQTMETFVSASESNKNEKSTTIKDNQLKQQSKINQIKISLHE
jgi:hypothetical protein